MVSTRSHPSNFPATGSSPSKNLSRSKRDPTTDSASPPPMAPNVKANPQSRSEPSSKSPQWVHTPSHLILVWLLVSLPLVFWDTGYVLLRPHSMPGGYLHAPLWKPYALYGVVDYMYGFPAWNARNGFTSAQGVLNLIESAGYVVYLWMIGKYGKDQDLVQGRGAPSFKTIGWIGKARIVDSKEAGLAVLIGFSAAVMTVSKTILYGLNEYFSGFGNIGHNDISSLIFLWIIPK